MIDINDSTVIQDIRDLVREAVVPATFEKVHFAVVPEGCELKSLKEFQYPHGLPPTRIEATPKFTEAASFISYVNTYKDHRTRIFADPGYLNFRALIDYHGAGADMAPEFVSHRAELILKLSDQWKLWMALNDKLIPQVEFAEFLEDNRADVIKPDGASLAEIARDLQSHSEVNFNSKVNSVNGAAVLRYEENVSAKVLNGTIEVPESFVLRIPIFFGVHVTEISARLRFRISEGKLRFQYKLCRPSEVVAVAFDEARRSVAEALTLDVLLGQP